MKINFNRRKNGKGTTSQNITFKCEDEKTTLTIPRAQLQADSWSFGKYITNRQYRFGDYFSVSNSIATLLNEAFLIESYTNLNELYIKTPTSRIERNILRPAISIKSSKRQQHPYIIFPYYYQIK